MNRFRTELRSKGSGTRGIPCADPDQDRENAVTSSQLSDSKLLVCLFVSAMEPVIMAEVV